MSNCFQNTPTSFLTVKISLLAFHFSKMFNALKLRIKRQAIIGFLSPANILQLSLLRLDHLRLPQLFFDFLSFLGPLHLSESLLFHQLQVQAASQVLFQIVLELSFVVVLVLFVRVELKSLLELSLGLQF